MTYHDIYAMKYNEVYGNYYWVDKALDEMSSLYTEEEDDEYKNRETFHFFNKWELKDLFIQNYTENEVYKKIDHDIESNIINSLGISEDDISLNNETFSSVSYFDYYNSFLNFKYICFDKYLEKLCDISYQIDEKESDEFDIRNIDTFEMDDFSVIYDIV